MVQLRLGDSPFKIKNFALGCFKSDHDKDFTLADVMMSELTPESVPENGYLRNLQIGLHSRY